MDIKKVKNVIHGHGAEDSVSLDWYDLQKKHLHLVTDKGVNILLSGGTEHLRDNDTFICEDGYAVSVKLKKQALYQLEFTDSLTFAKAAYEIGNRHMQINITENRIIVPDDPSLSELVHGFSHDAGIRVTKIEGYFYPNTKNSHRH